MKYITIIIATIFLLILAVACKESETKQANKNQKVEKNMENEKPRVTGVGGIFFKSENPDEMKKWYAKNLGLNTDQWGTNFEWYQGSDSTKKGFTQWSPFSQKTEYFEPSEKEFMINYRVVHLEKLLEKLKENGVTIVDSIQIFEYGKFAHILDNEGNKIELWEPNDIEYEKLVEGRTK